MSVSLHDALGKASEQSALPYIIGYNRIDGPGSSLDLREFQQAMWRLPSLPKDLRSDPSMAWSRGLPRTVGITIDTGTRVEAQPYDRDLLAVEPKEYPQEAVAGKPGEIPPLKGNWLLKILELFGLVGVKFVISNLRSGTKSSGLGGSATAATAVCLLANELSGKPFSATQLVSLASRMEQDLGVSITGTQEQSNVVVGGITDYLWFPWGVPGQGDTGYGSSIHTELLGPEHYGEIESRMSIFHTGHARASTDVNSVWMAALSTADGYLLHTQKLEVAYQFREGLRRQDWGLVDASIRKYREIRTALCPAYMEGAEEMQARANAHGGTSFPLGAGGGGGVLVFVPEPKSLESVREELRNYTEIPFRVRTKGHELFNLPL